MNESGERKSPELLHPTPEEAVDNLLKELAKSPTGEHFSDVQATLDEKTEATQKDVNAFRFILEFMNKQQVDRHVRTSGIFNSGRPGQETAYTYEREFGPYALPPVFLREKIARSAIGKVLNLKGSKEIVSVFRELDIEMPDNWDDLVTRYVAFPDHRIFAGFPYPSFNTGLRPTPVDTSDDWSVLKHEKIELALRHEKQDRMAGSDYTFWSYQKPIDEQQVVIKKLHKKMGLVYDKNGFLKKALA
jgi:hypothetical protein